MPRWVLGCDGSVASIDRPCVEQKVTLQRPKTTGDCWSWMLRELFEGLSEDDYATTPASTSPCQLTASLPCISLLAGLVGRGRWNTYGHLVSNPSATT